MSKKKRRGSKTAAPNNLPAKAEPRQTSEQEKEENAARRFASLRANKVNLASAAGAQSANNTINYDAAVREGKRIVAKMEQDWRRLCELADGIETRYDEQTLQHFAKDIGVVFCTFARQMSVYQAWKSAPGPESYPPCFAVARELQSHPDRFEIINANPNITKRAASELARQYRTEQATVTINPDWRRQQTARWFKDLNNLATKVIQQAQITNAVVPQQLLREIVEPMAAWLPTIREAGEACIIWSTCSSRSASMAATTACQRRRLNNGQLYQ